MTADRHASEAPADAPEWFASALSRAAVETSLAVDGVRVHARVWGDDDRRTIVLVHGGAANSHWWDHVAPALAERARVVAIDLSGHGLSGRRSRYSVDGWAREALTAATAGTGRRILVGHSLGGFACLRAAILDPPALDQVIAIDSPVRDADPDLDAALRARARPHRVHATAAEAVDRFAPRPAQAGSLGFVVRHIAEHSIVEGPAGWNWSFDPAVFDRPGLTPGDLAETPVPIDIVRAEHGMLTVAMAERMREALGPSATVSVLPGAGHHAMLDRPGELLTALQDLIDAPRTHG